MTQTTQERLTALAQLFGTLAASFVPGANAAAITALVRAGVEYRELLKSIQTENPEAWEQVRADYSDAVAALEASFDPAVE